MATRALNEESSHIPMPRLSSSLFTLQDDIVPTNKENQFDDIFVDEDDDYYKPTYLPQLRRKSEIEWMDLMRFKLHLLNE